MLEHWMDLWGTNNCCRFRLYALNRSQSTWKDMGNLGKRGAYTFSFPKIIESNGRENFVFSPQKTKLGPTPYQWKDVDMTYAYRIELWEKNTTWTRSPLNLPIDMEKIRRLDFFSFA